MLRVILGVTGGISAYKATGVIRLLTEAGHSVKVVPTANALRFIGAATLEALSHNSVDPDLYTDVSEVKHVSLGQEADLVIVAPATASFLARYAAGIADDLLGNVLLSTEATVVVAPAMHSQMWNHSATQANVALLRSRGVLILEPDSGRLTGADTGIGRLPEPEAIVAAALAAKDFVASGALSKLAEKRILVTAGGTHEAIDTVRYIANRSSGKQGLAIARVAKAAGAEVTLIAANLQIDTSGAGTVIAVESAHELSEAVSKLIGDTDVFIMAAAVADYRVAEVSETKLKRALLGSEVNLRLIANPDILKQTVSQIRSSSSNCLTVGFAAETVETEAELIELAKEKLDSKNCDILLANNVSNGAVFGSAENQAIILNGSEGILRATGSKEHVAIQLLAAVAAKLS